MILLALHMMWFTSNAHAMMSTADACPKKFIAKVEEVVEAQAPLSPRSTDKVVLKPEEILKGEVAEKEVIQVLTFSTLKMSKGETYMVELNEDKICSVTAVSEEHSHL